MGRIFVTTSSVEPLFTFNAILSTRYWAQTRNKTSPFAYSADRWQSFCRQEINVVRIEAVVSRLEHCMVAACQPLTRIEGNSNL